MAQETPDFTPPFELTRVFSDYEGDYFNIRDNEGKPMLYVANDEMSIKAAELLIKLANSSETKSDD